MGQNKVLNLGRNGMQKTTMYRTVGVNSKDPGTDWRWGEKEGEVIISFQYGRLL